MILTKLTLKNFKSHLNTVIDFNPGISIIVGENGAGKSTIFEAISFALFKQYTGKKINDLIRTNKDKDSKIKMSVELEFLSKGVGYKIIRERTSSQSKAYLFKKDLTSESYSKIAESDKQVNDEIQAILEMDADLFLNAIYIRQGEIADLIGKTPSERKQLIGKLLKLEELEKAWKNFLPLINNYENDKAQLKGKLSSETELNYELKSKMSEFERLKINASEAEDKKQELDRKREENIAVKSEMEAEKAIFDRLNNNLLNEKSNLNILIKDKENLHKELSELTRMENEMNVLKKYSEKLPIYLDFKQARDNLFNLKNEEEKQKQTVEDIKKYENILEEEKPNYDEYLSLEGKIKALESKKLELESDIKLFNEYENEKSNTFNEIESNKMQLKDFTSNIDNVLKDFDLNDDFTNIETDEDFDKLKLTVEKFRIKIREELDNNQNKEKMLNNELITLNEGIKSSQKPLSEIKEVNNQCPICKSDISSSKKEELIKSYENIISTNNQRIKEINQELDNLIAINSGLSSKSNDLENIEKGIYSNKHIASNLIKLNSKVNDLDKQLVDFEDKKEELNDLNELIKSSIEKRKILETNYNNYLQSQGALKSLGKEHEITDVLYKLSGKITHENEKIKQNISLDSYLSLDISSEELDEKIEELKLKDQKFNQLKGSIRQKENTIRKLDDKNREIELKRAKIDKIKKDIESSKYDENEYHQISILESKINKEISENTKTLGETNGRMKEIADIMDSLKKSLETNRKYKIEYENLEDYINLLNEIRRLYGKDGIQKILRARSKPVIQKYTHDFFEQFNFNYSNLILDDEYNITLYGPEGEATLDMVSGGEKIAIALALRLGITQAMSKGNIETILLDEPTIHLDSYRRHELIDLLRSLSVLPQMIIVTHDSELENAADTIIKVKKENGISKIEID